MGSTNVCTTNCECYLPCWNDKQLECELLFINTDMSGTWHATLRQSQELHREIYQTRDEDKRPGESSGMIRSQHSSGARTKSIRLAVNRFCATTAGRVRSCGATSACVNCIVWAYVSRTHPMGHRCGFLYALRQQTLVYTSWLNWIYLRLNTL